MASRKNMIKYFDATFIFCAILGWFLAGKFHMLYTFKEQKSLKNCPENDCKLCSETEKNNLKIENEKIGNSFYRQYHFKPQNVNEDMLSRWKVMSSYHQYEMINEEPRIGLNGMWRLEQSEVAKRVTFKVIDESKHLPFRVKNIKVNRILRRTDPFSGTRYITKILYDKSYKTLAMESGEVTSHVGIMNLQRGFINGKPKLVKISRFNSTKTITIISPISGVTERFENYLNRMTVTIETASKMGTPLQIKMLFVIFKSSDEKVNSDTVSVIEKFKTSTPLADVQLVIIDNQPFNRAIGLDTGTKHCNDDELMLFMDVDLKFTVKFLMRVILNTVRHETVFFPVVFSEFDPEIIDKAVKKDIFQKTNDNINDYNGFWLHFGFGILSVYKSDYTSVGGFKLDIKGWGGEDVDLYEKFIKHKNLKVVGAVDPDLIHVYHSRGCDPNLTHDQYRMCIGSWSDSLASQIESAALYLDLL